MAEQLSTLKRKEEEEEKVAIDTINFFEDHEPSTFLNESGKIARK